MIFTVAFPFFPSIYTNKVEPIGLFYRADVFYFKRGF